MFLVSGRQVKNIVREVCIIPSFSKLSRDTKIRMIIFSLVSVEIGISHLGFRHTKFAWPRIVWVGNCDRDLGRLIHTSAKSNKTLPELLASSGHLVSNLSSHTPNYIRTHHPQCLRLKHLIFRSLMTLASRIVRHWFVSRYLTHRRSIPDLLCNMHKNPKK